MKPLRLMVFDKTDRLTPAWASGSLLYRALGRLDATKGVTSWEEAFDWLAAVDPSRPIGEIQYWGHGKWGSALVDRTSFDASVLAPGHALSKKLAAIKERLAENALFWFRTCETFGAAPGIDFAERLADHLGARVAGHTFIIGVTQSGLHGLHPGVRADWSNEEGLAEGTPDAPVRALWSNRKAPRTITCFDGSVPDDWFTRSSSERS